nr:MAG TPA: hypothetical protein [Bacteriophage sp.]
MSEYGNIEIRIRDAEPEGILRIKEARKPQDSLVCLFLFVEKILTERKIDKWHLKF